MVMKILSMVLFVVSVCSTLPSWGSYKIEDLKDHATEGQETIAKPDCMQIQQECKGSLVDIKKREAYEHCVEKKLTSHCTKNYGRETQTGLYESCINTQCGQRSEVIEDPTNPADTKTGVRADDDRIPAPDQADHVALPENRVIAVEKNQKGQKIVAPFDVNTTKSRIAEQKEKVETNTAPESNQADAQKYSL